MGCIPPNLQWWFVRNWFRTACGRAISEVDDSTLRDSDFVVCTDDPPSDGGGNNQDAGSDCENGSPSCLLKRSTQPSEIIIARAAGAEMAEPLFCFREGHLARGDFPENFGSGAPYAVRIRELLEQTTA